MPDRSFAVCSAPRAGVLQGARAYGRVLSTAGGSEAASVARPAGRTAALCVGLYASPPYDLQVPALAVSRLSINLTPARVSGGLEGERPRCYDALRHSMFLTPAGAAAQWRKAAHSRHINIYFHAGAFEGGDDDDGWLRWPLARQPVLNRTLPGVRGLVDELADELVRADPLALEAVDSLARLLLVRLARRPPRAGRAPHPLSPAVLARLHEFVEAHLAERILVADLAAVAGLSPHRFAHLYSELTGQTPHRFVLARRLARAVALLALPHPGLAEVAAACGFASQQHLTHTMRRELGTTPGRCRASQAALPPPSGAGCGQEAT